MDHLPVGGPEARAQQDAAFLLTRGVEEDVRDVVRWKVQVDVEAMPVRRPDPAVPELVPSLRVRLNQPEDMVGLEEPESPIPNRHCGDEVSEVDPPVRVHLEAVPLGEVAEDPGHRAAHGVDLLVFQEEAGGGVAAHRADLVTAIVSVRTTFPEQGDPPEALVSGPRLITLRAREGIEVILPHSPEAAGFEPSLEVPEHGFFDRLAMEVHEARPA